MKTLIFAVCLLGALAMQGCMVYAEPVGGYYYRAGFWYYRDGYGREYRENHRYHHTIEDEHREWPRR